MPQHLRYWLVPFSVTSILLLGLGIAAIRDSHRAPTELPDHIITSPPRGVPK